MILPENFTILPEDLRGWNGRAPIFKELVDRVKPKVIIEVGTWKGQSTISMAEAAGPDTKIYCVDTWKGSLEFPLNEEFYGEDWSTKDVYEKFISNCVHHNVLEKIEAVVSESKDADVPMAQLIYIDGDHTYEGVKADLEKYWKNLEPGGVMFGDDYYLRVSGGRKDGYEAGVGRAVDEFAKENGLKVETAHDNFWIIRKNNQI